MAQIELGSKYGSAVDLSLPSHETHSEELYSMHIQTRFGRLQ